MDNLQQKKRTLMVAIDFKAAFDRIWKSGLLRDLAQRGLSSRCIRWLKAFLSDRRAAVKWNNRVSKYRVFKQGVPQGSPLSPLLFCLATALLPKTVLEAAPDTEVDQFADDFTLCTEGDTPEEAAGKMQPALDAVTNWAKHNKMEISVDKTQALIVSLDPRETAGKAQPDVLLDNITAPYTGVKKPGPVVLGVTFDSQMRFGFQADYAKKKLNQRIYILQALSGRKWGFTGVELKQLWTSYARPGGLYAVGVWGSFLSKTHLSKLEVCNNKAARLITGAPRGSAAVQTCAEAGLPPLTQVIQEEAATLLHKYQRLPEDHYLHRLGLGERRPRLKSKGEDGMRPDWRGTARKRLDRIGPNQDVREQLKQQREELRTEHYNQVTPETNFHRRATKGIPLPHDTNRTREDEITLHQLRLNRFPYLQQTLHRFGKADSPNCLECNEEVEETSEHFLLQCPRWTEERHQHLGHEPTELQLQDAPANILSFLQSTGRKRPPNL